MSATLVSPGVSVTVGGCCGEAFSDAYAEITALDATTLEPVVHSFIASELQTSSHRSVSTYLSAGKSVQMGSLKVNGFFDPEEKMLAVAVGKPVDQWLPIFVHETCHRDQFTENCKVWRQTVRGCEPIEIIDLWLAEVVELKPITLYQMIMGALKVELDCEKRSAKKIKKWKLPIDVPEYIQKANSYLYFYHMLGVTRKWYDIGTEPYNVPEVWQHMPTDFKGDYTKLPTKYKKLYLEHCFKGATR